MVDRSPVANGISTDHPVPGLPFVEDNHIPLDDPKAIERIGRHAGTNMWGRWDGDEATGEWFAFTTDSKNHSFAWVVRHHPEHGRSVLLYRRGGETFAHHEWFQDRALLERAGGYWWDGATWYRPRQVLSWARERYVRRPVRQPTTITAEDMLDGSCKPALGELHKIAQFEPAEMDREQWRHDLALWAARRRARGEGLPLARCVVTLNAPELAESALLGIDQVAKEAGIAASTLRAYITRDEGDVPLPQTTDGGRKRWSRPVVKDWIEQRRREPSAVVKTLTDDPEHQLAPGLEELWQRLTEATFDELWSSPAGRRRWSRPHRNEQAAQSTARELAWRSALHLESAVPFEALAKALEYAVLWELWNSPTPVGGYVALFPDTGQLLGWFVRHRPSRVPTLFGSIIREAEGHLDLPQEVTAKSLRVALEDDGGFSDDQDLEQFLDVTLPPVDSA